MMSTTRKRDGELVVTDGIATIPSLGAFRPVTLVQGIVAIRADANVREACVKKMQ
jgi:hypothetical protein